MNASPLPELPDSKDELTSMSVLLNVGLKCTLAASHALSCYVDGTDRQTDGRQTVTLRFPLDA